MTSRVVADPVGPLIEFSKAIGMPDLDWQGREDLARLRYELTSIRSEQAASLRLDQVTSLVDTYGEGMKCTFFLGDLPVLEVLRGVSDADLEGFRRAIAESPDVRLDFSLDKTRLAADWYHPSATQGLYLYLFPSALERLLLCSLGTLESMFWGSDPSRRIVLLLAQYDIELAGEWLAIVGGSKIVPWLALPGSKPPDTERARSIYTQREQSVRWQETWLKQITPLHFRVSSTVGTNDAIAASVSTHFSNLVLMYTSDRVVEQPGRMVAMLATTSETIDVPLPSPSKDGNSNIVGSTEALGRLFDWIYDPTWVVDRLPLHQITAAQALRDVDPAARRQHLTSNADFLYKELQWRWKSLVEGKVRAYSEQMHAVEEYLALTVQIFADQIAAMIKSLSDTVLAAVAAFLVSFVAAISQKTFNRQIFTLGMVVYAVYVLGFPLAYNMLYQGLRYRRVVSDFQAQCRRFGERLSEHQIESIVSTRITTSQRSFTGWFWATVVLYVVIVAVAIIATQVVPGIVAKSPPSSKQPVKPSATHVPSIPPVLKHAVLNGTSP